MNSQQGDSPYTEILADENPPVALFDLDGTLADFDGALSKAMNRLAHPCEAPFSSDRYDEGQEPEYITARRRLIKSIPGFWRDLPALADGFRVYGLARTFGYRTMVLSRGPRTNGPAWGEKLEWCRLNLPESCQVTLTEDKGLVYGKVLVDDWPPYIMSWLEFRKRGLVIMPARPWNANFNHPQVLRYVYDVNEDDVTKYLAARLLG